MGERSRSTGKSQVSLVELAEDWLTAKEFASRSTSVNSTLARRRDLSRWGRAIRAGLGRPVDDTERLSIEGDLAGVRLSDLTADNCLEALAVLRGSGKASSTARALSTWRGFCHWLTRRGCLKVDPTDDDLLTAPAVVERLPRAFTADEIDQPRSSATQNPRPTRPPDGPATVTHPRSNGHQRAAPGEQPDHDNAA